MYQVKDEREAYCFVPCFGVISISGCRHCVFVGVLCAGLRLSRSVHALNCGAHQLPVVFPPYVGARAVNICALAAVFGQVSHPWLCMDECHQWLALVVHLCRCMCAGLWHPCAPGCVCTELWWDPSVPSLHPKCCAVLGCACQQLSVEVHCCPSLGLRVCMCVLSVSGSALWDDILKHIRKQIHALVCFS